MLEHLPSIGTISLNLGMYYLIGGMAFCAFCAWLAKSEDVRDKEGKPIKVGIALGIWLTLGWLPIIITALLQRES